MALPGKPGNFLNLYRPVVLNLGRTLESHKGAFKKKTTSAGTQCRPTESEFLAGRA